MAKKDTTILIVVFLLVAAFMVSLFYSKNSSDFLKAYNGIYVAVETSDAIERETLPTRHLKIVLNNGFAVILNSENGQTIMKGEFTISAAPKSSPQKGSMQINIAMEGSVFKPSIYYYKNKIYYMSLDKEPITLTIFELE